MKSRLLHHHAKKALELVHATEILNLEFFDVQMIDERTEEIARIFPFDEELDRLRRLHRLRHVQRSSMVCRIAVSTSSGA